MSTNPKDELIAACVKGGMSEADCIKKMTDSMPPKAVSDADLMRENQMLRAEVEARKGQLKQAKDVLTRANQATQAAEDAEKIRIIDSVIIDSAYTKEQLAGKDLKELQTINTTLQLNNNKNYASVAADRERQDAAKKVRLTAGSWDSVKKEWIGGL